MIRRAVLALAIAACGGGDDDPAAPDASTVDPRPDAPPGCTRPALDPGVIGPYVQQTVTELAASPRATTTEREAARTYLTQQLAAAGWTPTLQIYAGGANVVADIPATMGADPRIVVGAHFDTVSGSPGANDNASGVAVVLAVARLLADVPCRRSPVSIVLFDQEELGLFGSRAFAQTLAPADVLAVHTIDQVSWDSDGDRVFELELPTPALEQAWRAAAQVIGVTVVRTSTSGTDHEAFRDRGFAAVGLTEEFVGGDTSPFRHQSGDTAATVDADYLTLAARLTAQVVIEQTSL
ncbi:MAG TPA: M28 family peptidase [Kofleriaceae bacterium]|nr:M28 family peptidase [Kofleriaceae bacterium]